MNTTGMTAWLIAHPKSSAGLMALLANLAVGIAAYLLSGAPRRHTSILIAWGIQTFADPKRADEEKAFPARPNDLRYPIHAKTAKSAVGDR